MNNHMITVWYSKYNSNRYLLIIEVICISVIASIRIKLILLYNRFQEHVKAHHPKDILSLDEFLRLRQKVLASKPPTAETPAVAGDDGLPPGMEPESDAPPGEAPPGMEGVVDPTSVSKPLYFLVMFNVVPFVDIYFCLLE